MGNVVLNTIKVGVVKGLIEGAVLVTTTALILSVMNNSKKQKMNI